MWTTRRSVDPPIPRRPGRVASARAAGVILLWAAMAPIPVAAQPRPETTGGRTVREIRRVTQDSVLVRRSEEVTTPPETAEEWIIPPELPPTLEELSGVFTDSILVGSVGDSLIYQGVLKPLPRELEPFGQDFFADMLLAPPRADYFAAVPPDFVVGPGDSLTLFLWGRVEALYGLRVDREGNLFIPQVGRVTAWGLTMNELEARVRKELSRVFTDFEMSLVLGEIRSIRVYVMGEVKRPADYVIPSLYTAFSALHLAGGPNQRGSFRDITIIRGGRTLAVYDLYDFLLRGKRTEEIKLQSGDVIHVPLSGLRVSLRGEVRRPAIYDIKEGERLLDVIGMAGGLTPKAHLGRVMIDRVIENERREILDLDLSGDNREKNNIVLQDHDDISIFPIYPLREQVVWIQGAVKYPGAYRREPGMKVADLMVAKGALLDDVFMERADLIRKMPEGPSRLIPIDLAAALRSDPEANIELFNGDRLTVYSYWDKNRRKYLSITGEVRNPGVYELREGYRLSDIIFESGPLLRSAYHVKAEIARLRPGRPDSVITTSIEDLSARRGSEADILLQEDDYVLIRRIPEWQLHSLVTIDGEVRFPGEYPLESRNEKLSRLIERAGGFTDNAFLKGAVFIRPNITQEIERQNLRDIIMRITQEVIQADSLGWQVRQELIGELDKRKIQRIVIDLEHIWRNRGKAPDARDVVLMAGDNIFIPPQPTGIHVLGSIASTGTIQFTPGEDFHYYIDRCGGFTKNADKKKVRVVRADGRVFERNLRALELEAGDTVIVPIRLKREINWLVLSRDVVSIVSGAVTTVFIITRLGR